MLTVYVPAPGSRLRRVVLAASAVVGCEQPGPVEVYFEGDRFGDGMDFHTRLELAAGRLTERYPTVARATVDDGQLIEVGDYEPDWRRLTVTDRATLAAWLAVDVELLDSSLGSPRPPARAERGHPQYFVRLSERMVAGAPLSSSEMHDVATKPHRLTPAALRLLTGPAGR
jgi:hypothetical protein